MDPAPRRRINSTRPSAAVYRRRRLGVGFIASSLIVVGVVMVTSGGKTRAVNPRAAKAPEAPAPAIESGLLPWSLASPLSRMNVYPSASGVVMAGGLTAGQLSQSGVYTLDTSTGKLQQTGSRSL